MRASLKQYLKSLDLEVYVKTAVILTFLVPGMTLLVVLSYLIDKDPGRFPAKVGYAFSMLGVFVVPAVAVFRHRVRQRNAMTRIRAVTQQPDASCVA